jgi:hypothetical protein
MSKFHGGIYRVSVDDMSISIKTLLACHMSLISFDENQFNNDGNLHTKHLDDC